MFVVVAWTTPSEYAFLTVVDCEYSMAQVSVDKLAAVPMPCAVFGAIGDVVGNLTAAPTPAVNVAEFGLATTEAT